jgi:predicted transposase/invertase (TIGR01784 family)
MLESVIDQEIWQEWFQEGFELGLEQKAQEIARNMLSKGFDITLIVEVTDLTVEQIQKLQAQVENTEIQ